MRLIHQPVVDELRQRGTPYHGVLYAGLMLTGAGPSTLEFNCRFGDPETQCVLPRLRSDLRDLLERSVRPGGLSGAQLEWSPEPAVTVVLASGGYPESSSKGDSISGIGAAEAEEGVEVFHAGTAADGSGGFVTAGGRVLNVVGRGPTLAAARERAYAGADRIRFDGRRMRRDIAARAQARVQA